MNPEQVCGGETRGVMWFIWRYTNKICANKKGARYVLKAWLPDGHDHEVECSESEANETWATKEINAMMTYRSAHHRMPPGRVTK